MRDDARTISNFKFSIINQFFNALIFNYKRHKKSPFEGGFRGMLSRHLEILKLIIDWKLEIDN